MPPHDAIQMKLCLCANPAQEQLQHIPPQPNCAISGPSWTRQLPGRSSPLMPIASRVEHVLSQRLVVFAILKVWCAPLQGQVVKAPGHSQATACEHDAQAQTETVCMGMHFAHQGHNPTPCFVTSLLHGTKLNWAARLMAELKAACAWASQCLGLHSLEAIKSYSVNKSGESAGVSLSKLQPPAVVCSFSGWLIE